MKIDFAKLQYQYQLYKGEVDARIQQVLDKSNYIMGAEVNELEEQLQSFSRASKAVTCSSGTDALVLSLMALELEPGDEVITTPFTFIATAEAIALLHLKPVFVDIEPKTLNIDSSKIAAAITEKTKVIMPVSLYGQPANLSAIKDIASKHSLTVIIDGAQSFGAEFEARQEVDWGDIYTTSFFPAKPLGCYGDGGAVLTNSDEIAERIRMLRVHGQNKRYHHKYIGLGGRLDTIQAAVLLAKLPHYQDEIIRRQEIAKIYASLLSDRIGEDKMPFIAEGRKSVYAQYTLKVGNRDQVQATLKETGIPTAVHYPMPLHLQECFSYLGYSKGDFPVAEAASEQVMSLPMNAFLEKSELEFVADNVAAALAVEN